MRALRFYKTGSLDNLVLEDVRLPEPTPDEVLVQVKAAAVNPSDLKNVLGKMHITTVPRIPGRDFAGLIVKGAEGLVVGQPVFGTGTLGFDRDGSHAEFMAVPASLVVPLPKNLNFAQAAGIGVAYLTAWAAMVDAAEIKPGETVLILGATGAVGSAAARIAHRLGAKVIGVARRKANIPPDGFLPVDHWIDLENGDLPADARQATAGKGADVVFDVVGGQMFAPSLACLARRGRQIAISSSPEPRVSFNLVDFYHNESRLLGVDSLGLSFQETGNILRRLTPGFEAGDFPPPEVDSYSLEQGLEVYRGMNEFKIKTKSVLIPGSTEEK
jgi:NADPH:quinone reductase